MTKARQPKLHRIVKRNPRGFVAVHRVVLGAAETPGLSSLARRLRDRGLEVLFVSGAEGALRAAGGRTDTAVVVPVATEAEGGLLTTAKIVTALPTSKVILVTPLENERVAQFAEFIDARIVFESDGPEGLFSAIVE